MRTLALLLTAATACRYEEAATYRANKMFFTEYFMYASNAGPWPFSGGESYVLADLRARLNVKGTKANVTVMAFSTQDELDSIDAMDLCHHASEDEKHKRKVYQVSGDHLSHLYLKYPVKVAGLQYLALQVCEGGWTSGLQVNGVFEFRNPYGFVPGRYFGFLPFEGARCISFALFVLYYLCVLCAHSGRLLTLHLMTFLVLLICVAESASSFIGYYQQNQTGRPQCCPFPKIVVASMILELLRRGATRVLLLVVALGYGLVRPRLKRTEECGVIVLTGAYLTASFFATVAKVRAAADPNVAGGPLVPLSVELPVLLFDLVFLACIYAALVRTMDCLRDSGQTFKLEKFWRLAKVLGGFVALVSVLNACIFAARPPLSLFEWPHQIYWLQGVSQELLNVGVIATISVIWQPTAHSRLLVSMQQLNTDEFGDTGLESDENDEFGEFEMTPVEKEGMA